MKKIYAVAIILIIIGGVSGIDVNWETVQSYSSPSQDHGRVCAYDNQDNLYIAGTFTNYIVIDGVQYSVNEDTYSFLDIFIAKFDSQNVCQWVKVFGGYHRDDIYGLKINDEGEIFIAGHVSTGVVFRNGLAPAVGMWDGFVAKLNSSGQVIWANTFGNNTIDFVYDLELDSQDNVYIAGHFMGTLEHDSDVLVSQGDKDIFVKKFDSSGNCLWSTSAGGYGSDYALALSVDEHQGAVDIYVVGSCENTCRFGNIQIPFSGAVDGFVARLNSDQVWDFVKTFECKTMDWTSDVYVDENSNVYVGGSFTESIIIDEYILETEFDGTDSFLFRMNNQGSIEWLEQLSDEGNNRIYRITPGIADNLIVSGMTGPNAIFGNEFTGPSGSTQLYTFDISDSGVWNWAKTNNQETNILNDFHLANIRCSAVNSNGTIAVTGSINGLCYFDNIQAQSDCSYGYESDNDAFWAILKPESRLTDYSEEVCQELRVKLKGNYPNPFNPETRIEFSFPEDTSAELSIYNIRGQRVKTYNKNHFEKGDNSVLWNGTDDNGSKCSSGVYFFRINTGKEIQTKKMIMMK